MRYKFDYQPDVTFSVWPVVMHFEVSTWDGVLSVLQYIHNRRLDFILTPHPEREGWYFDIAYFSHPFDHEKFLAELQKAAGQVYNDNSS